MSIDNVTVSEWNDVARQSLSRLSDIQELAELIASNPDLNSNELAVALYSSGVRYLPEMMRERA